MVIGARLLSRANGPGQRAVVWAFGCDLACKNCWNSQLWPHDQPDNETPEGLADWILAQEDIEGLTLSGGEFLQQAIALRDVLTIVKSKKPELSVGTFTGYNLEELESGRFKFRANSVGLNSSVVAWHEQPKSNARIWQQIKPMLDFAVMGRFQESKKTTADPMRSSTNQKLHLFTDRYKESDFERQTVEIKIQPGGLTTITGFPVGVKL